MRLTLIFVIVFGTAKTDQRKTDCTASIPTIRYVTSCPKDKDSWRKAELEKNCESLAKIQDCVKDPSEFKYHCLVNSYADATLEVCAPIRFVSGFCADFNTLQSRVTENHNIDCTNTTPACPRRYISTDIYKYQACYTLNENVNGITNSTQSTLDNMVQVSSTSNFVLQKFETKTSNDVVIVLGTLLSILIFIGISVAGYKLRKRIIIHQRHRFPLDSRNVRPPLLPFDFDPEDQLFITEYSIRNDTEQQKETDDLKSTYEWKGEKYYRLVLKDKSNLMEEDKDKNEDPTDILSSANEQDPTDLLASANESFTKNFLAEAKLADNFYEETKIYEKGHNDFMKNSVVILTGPPGFGKTQTAIHLMMPYEQNWVIRKIENYFELNYIECAKDTIIFIDNIFYGKLNEFKEWMKPLEKLDRLIDSMEPRSSNSQETGGKIKVMITAKSDIIEEACQTMGGRSIFKEDRILNLSEEQFKLDDDEKKRILLKQVAFAKKEKAVSISTSILTDSFWEKVLKSEAHIGFPLCAHLFAFEEAYRSQGEYFFSWPTQLVFKQIDDVVKNDKSYRKKTLLLFLLLLEIYNRDKKQTKYIPEFKNEKKCAEFLKKTCRLGDHFQPLNFKNLPAIASELTWTFIRKTGEKSYQFIHQSVFDAVERYIFRSFPIKAIALLPLNVIERQTSDKEDLTWLKGEHYEYLAKRFIAEAKCTRSSQICECEILNKSEFIQKFQSVVSKLDEKDLVDFFSTKSWASPKLPILFWLGRSEATQLLQSLISVIKDRKDKDINVVDHIYYSLYGECTKKENPNSMVRMKDVKSSEVKDLVLSFKDNSTDNTILHMVVQSAREDDFANIIVKQLTEDKEDHINARNRDWKTPLMLAATWPVSQKLVIKHLVEKDCEVAIKDRSENSVFHCCVDADTDDITCEHIIDIVLSTSKKVDLSMVNTRGLTALNLACKSTKNSRILSICRLLEYDYFVEQDGKTYKETALVDKVDSEGKNPILNTISCLTSEDELVEMERLLRVCILLLYGADPYLKSDDADMSALKFCKEKCYKDLESIMTSKPNVNKNDTNGLMESRMLEAINKGIKRLSKNHTTGEQMEITLKFPKKIPDDLEKCLANAIQYLAKKPLISSSEK